MGSVPSGSSSSSIALKLVAGSACGYLAYKARGWESGPDTSFVVWTLLALAANFYLTVTVEFAHGMFCDIFTPRSANSTPMMESAFQLIYSMIAVALAALAARFGQMPLLFLVKTEHNNVLSLLLAGSLWTFGIIGVAPFLAGRYSAQAFESLVAIVDRRSIDRPIYAGITAVLGVGMWALTMYLVYLGWAAGRPYS